MGYLKQTMRLSSNIHIGIRAGLVALVIVTCFGGCASADNKQPVPGDKFDLSHWKIALPLDDNKDGQPDRIDVPAIQAYAHPDFFYLDEHGGMVFVAPNKAVTTTNSSNTRSELRQQLRGANASIANSAPGNNFALQAHPASQSFAAIGGKMEATLKVDHVALRTDRPNKKSAYAVVVGQIHAGKDQQLLKDTNNLFGWGNEPLKIIYKKWPHHESGSVFWNYERNLGKTDRKRRDISYPVWGNDRANPDDPGAAGIKLGEEFSYVVNVHDNIMSLEFSAEGKETITYSVDLSNNITPYGKPDPLDNEFGYSGDWHYFKAGAYNQCTAKASADGRFKGCAGSGDWSIDKANGDYTQVTFSRLVLSPNTSQ